MIVLLSLMLAAAPQIESIGSVDGPFLVADTRASVDSVSFELRGNPFTAYSPIAGLSSSGLSGIVQGQLFGGWGVRAWNQRLALTVSAAATGWLTSPEIRDGLRLLPRLDVTPVLLSIAAPLPIDGVVLVPILGVTIPTRNGFDADPVVSLQPQLRFRASHRSLIFGANALVNVPVITKWDLTGREERVSIRCPADETRCRWPVTRELWLAAFSAQAEYWFSDDLSAGLRTKLEFRDEDLGLIVNSSGAPEGTLGTLAWSVVDLQATMFSSWAFSRLLGVSASLGLGWQQRVERSSFTLDRTGWNASISIWFRTDSRLSRFWLDH